MSRAEKIKIAKLNLDKIKTSFEKAKYEFSIVEKQFNTAKFELDKATASFDIGEKVKVVTLCKRGCCVESRFEGTIFGITDNGSYSIKMDDGKIAEYVYGGDMERLKA